jgi:hypothetical protein
MYKEHKALEFVLGTLAVTIGYLAVDSIWTAISAKLATRKATTS